jgi:hypothetical protein
MVPQRQYRSMRPDISRSATHFSMATPAQLVAVARFLILRLRR